MISEHGNGPSAQKPKQFDTHPATYTIIVCHRETLCCEDGTEEL
ncbi:MAG: hypothetical protein V3T09_07100 [bacterium]